MLKQEKCGLSKKFAFLLQKTLEKRLIQIITNKTDLKILLKRRKN